MRPIDLADPTAPITPPPAHLLQPAVLLLVLAPLGSVAVLQHARSEALLRSDALQQAIIRAEAAVAEHAEAQRRIQGHQAVLDGVDSLHGANTATLALLPAISRHLPSGIRFSELSIDARSIRIAGSARAPAEVSQWLGHASMRTPGLRWDGPEIRDAAAEPGRVGFGLHIRRQSLAVRVPAP